MVWFWIILILIVSIIIAAISESNDKKNASERLGVLNTKISNLQNQKELKKIIGQKNRYAFVLDNIGRKVYYLDPTQTKEVSFDQIISVEILEDNTILSSKSTTRTVGGALLGGALAGGAGMVVGGLSGDSKQKKKVSKVTVKIKLRDYSAPKLLIPCFVAQELTPNSEIKPSDSLYGQFYKEELQNAQKIADYVSIIIDDVDRQEKQSQMVQTTSNKSPSVADELAKLASLKEQGILTDEEFLAQKEKILKQ